MLLRPLTARPLSRAAGWLLNRRVSCALIGPFIRKSGVRMADYLPETYHSFNDFFTRPLRDGARPLDNGDWFQRAGQQLIQLLSEVTADGMAKLIDLGLARVQAPTSNDLTASGVTLALVCSTPVTSRAKRS